MSAKVEQSKEENDTLTFTLTGVDVAYANAIRRTILSDIPVIGFKTFPYEENRATVFVNTSRLNNEIVKQRLSCIPICIDDMNIQVNNYLLEIDVENKTDTVMYVTTKDFKIKNVTTNQYLEEGDLRKIFPPFIPPTGKSEYFIDFLRLRPKISDEIPGERIKLTCEFSKTTAREDAMFNVAGTCSYGFTPDTQKIKEELAIRQDRWEKEGKTKEEITFESDNWVLLEGMRYVKKNSFDFILQTVGIYENTEIIRKACDVVIEKFEKQRTLLDNEEMKINQSQSTIENCYDITLENEDYTIGNILNYQLYSEFYANNMLTYVGFKKMHPHDDDSLLRIAFADKIAGKSQIKVMLKKVINDAIDTIKSIGACFDETKK
jgi:DNA-directed RNA polymerase subunit L